MKSKNSHYKPRLLTLLLALPFLWLLLIGISDGIVGYTHYKEKKQVDLLIKNDPSFKERLKKYRAEELGDDQILERENSIPK